MDAENTNFDDFFDTMDGDSGYQSGEADDAADTADTPTEEPGTDNGDTPQEGAEAAGGDNGEGNSQPDGNTEQPADAGAPAETFTLRVNKEDKTVTRDEMIVYAQKGADYDRVKTALEQERSTNSELAARVSQTEEVYTLISELAKESNMEVGELLDQFRVARFKSQGMSEDAARERLGRVKAEQELANLRSKSEAQRTNADAQQERAVREVAEFNQRYPGVQLNDEIVGKLKADVHNGMTLCEAYQKMVNAEKDAEIQRLQNELAAEKQNKANRSSSPGSMNDSGSKKTNSTYDDFFSAFDD